MAENKKSFILYADLIHTVKKMPKSKRADLFMTILEYVNDENPVVEDLVVGLVFEPIKHQLKRDLGRWETFKQKQAENGRLGGRPKKEETQINPNNPSLSEETQKSLNVTVNVNDTVTDNVNVNERKEFTVPHSLKNSNLFRQPNIPTKEKVLECFRRAGGTDEMAAKFYDNNEALGWFHKGSPITNFQNFIPGYISSWQKNEKNAKSNGGAVKLGTSEARVAALKTWGSTAGDYGK